MTISPSFSASHSFIIHALHSAARGWSPPPSRFLAGFSTRQTVAWERKGDRLIQLGTMGRKRDVWHYRDQGTCVQPTGDVRHLSPHATPLHARRTANQHLSKHVMQLLFVTWLHHAGSIMTSMSMNKKNLINIFLNFYTFIFHTSVASLHLGTWHLCELYWLIQIIYLTCR